MSTPSISAQLRSTLRCRPLVAKYIKSIHLGPLAEPPQQWPFSLNDEGMYDFRPGLRDHQSLSWASAGSQTCRERALARAVLGTLTAETSFQRHAISRQGLEEEKNRGYSQYRPLVDHSLRVAEPWPTYTSSSTVPLEGKAALIRYTHQPDFYGTASVSSGYRSSPNGLKKRGEARKADMVRSGASSGARLRTLTSPFSLLSPPHWSA